MADQKNLFLAVALSIVILISWNVMVEQPKVEQQKAAHQQQQAARQAQESGTGQATTPAGGSPVGWRCCEDRTAARGARRQAAALQPVSPVRTRSRRRPVYASTRRGPGINLIDRRRVDDLTLKDYQADLDEESAEIDSAATGPFRQALLR